MGIYSPAHGFFCHTVGKVCSGTLNITLRDHFGGEIMDNRRWVDDQTSFTFAFVRNPYDRVVSLYRFSCVLRADKYGFLASGANDLLSMVRLLEAGLVNAPAKNYDLVETQAQQLDGLRVDKTLRFESFESDLRSLPFMRHATDLHLPHHHKSRDGDDWLAYMTPEIVEAINDWCAEDFELYGYERLSP